MLKRLKQLTVATTIGIAVFAGAGLLIAACAPGLNQSEPESVEQYGAQAVIQHDGLDLFFVEKGDPQKPLIVFIHGTPGSWRAFRTYLIDPQLNEHAHMIAVDRFGFGRSAVSGAIADYTMHSRAIGQLFQRNASNQGAIVVGHSLGGTIGLRVALDHPDNVAGLVSISAALSPEHGGPRWYNRLGALPLVRNVIPGGLGLANKEILPIRGELQAMQPNLGDLTIPVTIIQGGKDPLVSPKNADYAEAVFTSATLNIRRYPDDGHFIIWERPEDVVEEILSMMAVNKS